MSTLRVGTISNSGGTASTSADNVINGSAKAWVNFNGTGTVAIRAAYNVSSITDNGTGDYTVNFTNAMPDGNYGVSLACRNEVSGGDMAINIKEVTSLNTSNFRMQCARVNIGNIDPVITCASIFR